MIKSKYMVGASISAIVLAGIGVQPAFAQDATSASTDNGTNDANSTPPAKKKKADKADSNSDDQARAIVVTARRKALETATDIKKRSDTIVDSVVADEAGHLPDNSITEVLARVPGVTMSRFNGSGDSFQVEGTGIQIRGLSNPSSMLNGREIFSANGGSGLSWGEVTPELMAAVDVYKATRADQLVGGTGGAIDLRTKMPFDYNKTTVEGTIGFDYGDLVKKVSPSGSVLVTSHGQTAIGDIGFLVDVAYSRLDSQDGHLSVEPYYKTLWQGQTRYIPGGFGWGDDHFGRERTGIYEAVQWRPANNLTFFQSFFSSNYKSHNDGASVWVATSRLMPVSGATTFDKNGVLVAAEHMAIASVGDGNAGSTIGQGWIPANQQVDCNTPYGTQAQTLDWSASPPVCINAPAYGGSSRGFSTANNTTRDFSQGFTWEPGRFRVRGAFQYVDSKASSTGMSAGLSVPITGYSFDITGSLPKFVIDNAASLADPASYGWSQLSWRPTDNHAHMYAENLDADYNLGDGFFRTLSLGGRVANRIENDQYQGTYWTPLGNGWDGSPQETLADGPASDSEFYPFKDFFHGNVPVPGVFYVPSASLLQSGDYNYVMNTYGWCKTCTDSAGNQYPNPTALMTADPGRSRTEVDTLEGYAEAKFESDSGLFGVPFTGNIGVRAVRAKTKADGYFFFGSTTFYMTQADANADFAADPTGTLTPHAVHIGTSAELRHDSSTDTRLMPAFNINFKPTDKFFVRFAASQTMSRPFFSDITVAGSGSIATIANTNDYTSVGPNGPVQHIFPGVFTGVTASIGNTTLKPTISTNFDLSFEWYRSLSTTAHLDFFHKSLKDLIILGNSFVPFPYSFKEDNGTVVSGTTTLSQQQAINTDKKATIQGFELGGQTFFDKLPGFWSGFGVNANFTFIDSKNPAPLSYDMNGNKFGTLPITGLSKYSYNVQLMYSKYGLYVGLAYNWRSRFLMSTNANGTGQSTTTYNYYYDTTGDYDAIHYALPLYGKAYGQLDLGINYQLNKHLRFFIQANNLTNAKAISEMEILPGKFYPRNYYEADRRVSGGINFKF
jgi:TonB-dependent receptor